MGIEEEVIRPAPEGAAATKMYRLVVTDAETGAQSAVLGWFSTERAARAYAEGVLLTENYTLSLSNVPSSVEVRPEVYRALCWLLYSHQGGSSPIGKFVRELLGMGWAQKPSPYMTQLAKQFEDEDSGFRAAAAAGQQSRLPRATALDAAAQNPNPPSFPLAIDYRKNNQAWSIE